MADTQPVKVAQQHPHGSDKSSQMDEPAVSAQQENTKVKYALIFWGYFVVYVAFFGVCVYFAITTDKQLETMASSDSYYYGNQVAYAWKQGFVNDVKIVSAASDCPTGYSDAFSFNWPGSGYGCYCNSSLNVSFVVEGYCTAQLIQKQCLNIKAQEPVSANIWRNGSRLCIRRSVINFYNEPLPGNSTRICGRSNSLVVIPFTEPCPLVNLSYTAFPLQNNMVSISSSTMPTLYGAFDSTSPYSFYSYPINRFAVSEYEFCLIDTDSGLSPEHDDYVLLNNYRGCSETGNYTTIDTMDEAGFYAVNSGLSQLTAAKGFPAPKNWDYNLGFESTPSWTYKCRFNYQKVYSVVEATEIIRLAFRETQTGLFIPIYIVFGIISIELVVLFVRRVFRSDIYPDGFKKVPLPRQFLTGLLRILLDLICKCLLFAIFIFLCYKSFNNWNWIVRALALNCPDNHPQLVQHVLFPYRDMYLQLYNQYVVLVAATALMIVIDCVYEVWVYRSELRYYLESASNRLLVRDQEEVVEKDLEKDLEKIEKEEEPRIEEAMKRTGGMFLEGDVKVGAQRIRKKNKVKRIGRNLFNSDSPGNESSEIVLNDFNPYQLDDTAGPKPDSEIIQLGAQRGSPRKKVRRR